MLLSRLPSPYPACRVTRLPLAALLLLAVCAGEAAAVPPPMSPKELEEKSDFVGTVRVLAVVCTDRETRPHTHAYQAWLQVVTVKKGKVEPGQTLLVGWVELAPVEINPGVKFSAKPVYYFPGEQVYTHLRWDPDGRAYRTTWRNAKGERTRQPDTTTLPTKPGEVVSARPPAPEDFAK